MKTAYNKQQQEQGHNYVTDGQRKVTEGQKKLTLKILGKVDRQELAEKIEVSVSMLSKIASQEKGISAERMFEFLKAGKLLCREERDRFQELEDEIDMMLILGGQNEC